MTRDEAIEKIQQNRQMLKKFSVQSIAVFGSVARGESRPDSDVDILVEFEPDARIGLFGFLHLKEVLAEMLGRPVDLVTRDALHPALKESILEEAVHVA